MFKHLILPWLLPIFGLFFAAGADGLAGAETGGSDAGNYGISGEGDLSGGDADGADSGTKSIDAVHAEDSSAVDRSQQTQEEPEVQEFKGAVSARLRGLTKQAPELTQVFQKYPKIQQQIEATFRREAALREVFPTVAEARQMREEFPNGLADVQQLQNDVKEVEELDNDFYTQDRDGNYPGHAKIIDNMFRDDRKAAVALFRSLPKEWARLDRESYNEVMGAVVGATFANSRELADLDDALQSADPKRIESSVKKLFGWVNGFLSEKPLPTAEERKLSQERANFNRDRAERDQEDAKRFDDTFSSSNLKIEQDAIKAHPAVQKLLANKAITNQKKADILAQIHRQIHGLLKKSPAFMRKLTAAYNARNLGEASSVVKAAWTQQWLLNRMVRTVFDKEIPQLVSNNREAVKRRAGTTQPQSRQPGEKKDTTPKGPKQIGGRWYRDGGKGAPYTTAEVLAGKHLQP